MNIVNHKLFTAALSLGLLAGYAEPSFANDKGANSLKPLQALTFDAGQKRGVGYFTSATGNCRVVLTVAEAETVVADGFQATRIEISIPETQTARYVADGQTFAFTCSDHAEELTFKHLSTLASAADR